MDLFRSMQALGHEQVVVCRDPSCGYLGIIAIHDTTLGPALGGTRFWNYAGFDEALTDVLRLARGMTYKAAVAGLNLGGGKAVIVGDHRRTDREALFRAHGRFIESLGGRYITAEDVGTSPADMEFVRRETSHVAGLEDRSGDPSPVTGYGVFMGMRAAAQFRWGDPSLAGKTVAVQGCGKVAFALCGHLREAGARLRVTDLHPDKVERVVAATGATPVAPEAIYDQPAEIFAPCAMGAVLDDQTLPRLQGEIIAGAANNQLADPDRHGRMAEARGLLYAPDFVINGGGLINVYGELQGWSQEHATLQAGAIYDTTLRVFERARRDGVPTAQAADRLAEERLAAVPRPRPLRLGRDP